jgi:hypothetical protein
MLLDDPACAATRSASSPRRLGASAGARRLAPAPAQVRQSAGRRGARRARHRHGDRARCRRQIVRPRHAPISAPSAATPNCARAARRQPRQGALLDIRARDLRDTGGNRAAGDRRTMPPCSTPASCRSTPPSITLVEARSGKGGDTLARRARSGRCGPFSTKRTCAACLTRPRRLCAFVQRAASREAGAAEIPSRPFRIQRVESPPSSRSRMPAGIRPPRRFGQDRRRQPVGRKTLIRN